MILNILMYERLQHYNFISIAQNLGYYCVIIPAASSALITLTGSRVTCIFPFFAASLAFFLAALDRLSVTFPSASVTVSLS